MVVSRAQWLEVCARADPPVPWRRLWWSATRGAGRTRYTSVPHGSRFGPSHTSTRGHPAPSPSRSGRQETTEAHVTVCGRTLLESIFKPLTRFFTMAPGPTNRSCLWTAALEESAEVHYREMNSFLSQTRSLFTLPPRPFPVDDQLDFSSYYLQCSICI